MQLHVEWGRRVPLRDGSKQNLIYYVEPSRIPEASGVYIFGRSWGNGFEALYVGKAGRLRGRVKSQFNNLRLMQHLRNAKGGRRVLLCGRVVTKPGQRIEKALNLTERALIRYFLSEGDDLVNKLGTRLRRHEVLSTGKHPKRYLPSPIYLEKAKGE